MALAWRPFDVPVGFRAGWLAEQATLLGTMATGAFGQLSADAAVTGLETSFEIGSWHLAADAEIGKAHPQVRGGIITRMSSLTTSAFAFNATRRLINGGLIRIALSQPLRVEGGRAALSTFRSAGPWMGPCCDKRCQLRCGTVRSTDRRFGAMVLPASQW